MKISSITELFSNWKNSISDFGFIWGTKHIYLRTRWYSFHKGRDQYINHVKSYLTSLLSAQIDFYNNKFDEKCEDEPSKNIWVCWWEGKEEMPELCRLCYDNLCANTPSDYTVYLITKDNFKQYVDLPSYILERLDNGGLSITNLSDILREALLYNQGGHWIDASVWVSPNYNVFTDKSKEFWSINLGSIKKEYMLGQVISECKWSGFYLYGKRGNIVCKFAYEAMCKYFKEHNTTIDYFIQNTIIRIGYDNVLSIKKVIDDIQISNVQLYSMLSLLNEEYDITKWNYLCSNTGAFKLTQKRKYQDTINGKLTFWGAIKHSIIGK